MAEVVRYLLCDSRIAYNVFTESNCTVISEKQEIPGFEVYIVEQWACERKLNTSVVTYTGNPDHKLKVSIVSLPKDSGLWSQKTQRYFDELVKSHLRPKETDLGLVYVTNLSSFPSNLNLVRIPSGNILKAWDLFCVNEDLRRSGCGGRLVLSIGAPTDACEDKFKQIFRANEQVAIEFAVRELVTMVQICLFYCNLLNPEYVDGLLCNETTKAIKAWWDKWGLLRYHTQPTDGAFGPMTVAGIIGFTIGLRNRLASLINYKTPKDPFDVEYFVDSIRQFQKHEHLLKSMRVDEETVVRLYSLTDRSSNSDFFGIVKSTMKEVSGKQAQTLSDCETTDIDKLMHHLQGYRARYLWLGKGETREINEGYGFSCTGIPLRSICFSEIDRSNRDLRRAMIRTMTSQKQRTDEVIRSGVTKIRGLQRGFYYDEDANDSRSKNNSIDTLSPKLSVPTTEDESKRKALLKLRKYMGQAGQHETSPELSLCSTIEESSSSLNGANGKINGDVDKIIPDEIMQGPINSIEEVIDSYQQQPLTDSDSKYSSRHASLDLTSSNDLIVTVNHCSRLRHTYAHSLDGMNSSFNNESRRIKQFKLHRHHSFSTVSDMVLRWQNPFDVCPQHLIDTCNIAESFHRQWKGEISTMEKVAKDYKLSVDCLQSQLSADSQAVELIHDQFQQVVGKETTVKNHVRELEALTARLQYEARMLDTKMRDVEEAVDSFTAKVIHLERRTDKFIKSSPAVTNNPSNNNVALENIGLLGSFVLKYLTSLKSFYSLFGHTRPSHSSTNTK